MVFRSKYIFETKKSRFKRYFAFFSTILAGLLVSFILFCFFIIYFAHSQNEITEQAFYQRPPDLVVIFTGDTGRIPTGLRLAKEYNQEHIFITGVYEKNTVESLLRPLKSEYIQNPQFLEIDYLARNTVENVLATLRYTRETRTENRVLVVSHDYHILRISIIFNRLRQNDDESTFFFHAVKTDYKDRRNLNILFREVFKLVRAYAFLLLWDTEGEKS